jgi:hypothetical protein
MGRDAVTRSAVCPPPPPATAAGAPAWPAWAAAPAGRRQRQRPGTGSGGSRHCGPPPATPLTAPSQSPGNHAAGVARRQTAGDLFPLRQQQGPGCPTRRPALHPAGLQHKGAHRRSPFAKPPSDQPQRLTSPPPLPHLVLLDRRQPPRAHDHLQPPDPSEVVHSPMETANVSAIPAPPPAAAQLHASRTRVQNQRCTTTAVTGFCDRRAHETAARLCPRLQRRPATAPAG